MNDFADFGLNPNSFIVKNITDKKCVKIFNYPINPGQTRNLILIPGVSSDDIRASLLKGSIKRKLMAGEISIIESDLNLVEYNAVQKDFLSDYGITTGLTIGSDEITDELNSRINSIPSSSGGTNNVVQVAFDYTTSSPLILQSVLAGQIVYKMTIIITTVFDDLLSTIKVGTTADPSLIFEVDGTNILVLSQYDNDGLFIIPNDDLLILTITPGGSIQGAGMIYYWIT